MQFAMIQKPAKSAASTETGDVIFILSREEARQVHLAVDYRDKHSLTATGKRRPKSKLAVELESIPIW